MKENAYQGMVIGQLKGAGCEVLNKWGNIMEGRGWPDLYVAHRVWTGWIELKTMAHGIEVTQTQRMRRLIKRGVPCVVLRWTTRGEVIEDCEGETIAQRGDGSGMDLLRQLKILGGSILDE